MLDIQLENRIRKKFFKGKKPPSQESNDERSVEDSLFSECDIMRKDDSQEKPPLKNEEIILIKQSLSKHYLFTQLNDETINKLSKGLILTKIEKGGILFKEGSKGYFFYIVKSGRLQLSFEKLDFKKYFSSGDTFGEMALLQHSLRSGTVTCVEDAEIFVLDGKVFRETIYQINKDDFLQKFHFVNKIPIFQYINPSYLYNIIDKMIKTIYEKDDVIICQDELGEILYIIKEGCVICEKDGKAVRKLFQCDFFGENSLLFGSPRSMTIRAHSHCKLYQIAKSDLIKCLGPNFHEILLFSIVKNSLMKTQYLRYLLVEDFFDKLKPHIILKHFPSGKVIENNKVLNGNRKINIYFIISGTLSVGNDLFDRGSVFGEDYLPRGKEKRELKENIISETSSILYIVNWMDIVANISLPNIQENKILQFFQLISHIKKIRVFQNISDYQILQIAKKLQKRNYAPGVEIIKEKTIGNFVFFLYKGKVKITKENRYIREYQDYACFGEISVLKNVNHTATVTAVTKASVYLLSKEDFFSFIDSTMIKYLINKISLMDHFNITLDKLYYNKPLGKGKYGSVSLVHDEYKTNLFAIKSVNKQQAEKNKILTRNFQKEREILLKLDHPFIIKLIKTFQNKANIFYLMEYINGIELSKYLSIKEKKSYMNKYETQLYTANLLLIIHYLNSKHLIHRDIKPDNIMIRENGYLVLIDFNSCTEVKDLTSTMIGTPHYMAPEILMGKGYGLSVDYWSIGVVAYRIYYGYLPFGRDIKDCVQIYNEIINHNVVFPEENEVSELIGNLLKKNVCERTCNIDIIKKEKFFENLDWNALRDLKIKPSYIPPITARAEDYFNQKDLLKYEDYLINEEKRRIVEEVTHKEDKYSIESNNNNKQIDFYYNPDWAKDF